MKEGIAPPRFVGGVTSAVELEAHLVGGVNRDKGDAVFDLGGVELTVSEKVEIRGIEDGEATRGIDEGEEARGIEGGGVGIDEDVEVLTLELGGVSV